jgi:excinuclease ABC subunit B
MPDILYAGVFIEIASFIRKSMLCCVMSLRYPLDDVGKLAALGDVVGEPRTVKTMTWSTTPNLVPAGDQPAAIEEICARLTAGDSHVVLHGATGTGKSATMAWTLARLGRPALVLAPNKVLAAQLAAELRELLPDTFVGFFVSHFAYYRPEAYVPSTDTFIEKDSAVDSEIERLRHEATLALLTRPDVVIVASVSAIYGLGRPEEYRRRMCHVEVGDDLDRDDLIRHLVGVEYHRNDLALERGRIRVRGDIVDVVPASGEEAYRVEFFGNTVENLAVINPATGEVLATPQAFHIPPASHHVFDPALRDEVMADIRTELDTQLDSLRNAGKLLEAQRLEQRTRADLESLETTGMCRGIENYSRHFDRRLTGQPPSTLLDFFPENFVTIIDESHVTVSQIAAMFEGDQSRKRTLVEHGFRLPSALDNRPLRGPEFWKRVGQVLYLSATPGPWEREHSDGTFVEQIIRPTGLVDPAIEVRPTKGQFDDLLTRVRERVAAGERVLVTALTKRFAEQVADRLLEAGLRATFLHSDVPTTQRLEILRRLRLGEHEVLVGVNLLREGLDLPEVSLVAVFDADTQGFLRSATSLIQIIGRAARHPRGTVILYADQTTPAMAAAIGETNRRRDRQLAHNAEHGIDPTPLHKEVIDVVSRATRSGLVNAPVDEPLHVTLEREIAALETAMVVAAKSLRFEEAALMRDELGGLRRQLAELAEF